MKRTLVTLGGQFGLFLLMLFLAGTAARNLVSDRMSSVRVAGDSSA